MVDDINFDGVFSTGIIKATSWGSAIRQEMEKVRNSTKALREEWLALINESIDTSTTLGSQNYNALRNWNIASEDGSDVAEVYNESSDALKEYLDTCSSGKATWEGFVAHQKEAAAGLQSMAVGAKAAAVGMKILKAAMNMAVMMVAQWVIQKIVEGIDNLIHEQEKLHEAAEEARKQYEETVSELEAWEEALSNVKAQLAALESISTPTLADQAQTEELRKQNAELAFQVEYLKQKAEIEKQEKDENEDKEWNNFKNGGFKEELLAALHCGMQSSSKIKIEYEASDFSKYADYLRDVENLKAAEEEYNEIVSKGYSEASEARRKELEEDISTYKANILSVTSSIEESENEEAQALIKQRTYLLADAAGKAALLKATLNDIAISDNAVEVVERIATTISDDGTPNVMEFEVALHKAIPNDEDYNSFVDLAGGVDAVIAAFGTLPSVVDDSYAGALDEMRDFADLGSLFNNEETEDNIKSSITDLIDTAGEDFSIKFNETFGGLSDSVQNVLSSILSTDDLDTSGIYDFFSSIGKISEKFVADGEESMKRYQKASDDITSAFGKTIEGVSGNIGTIGELSAAMSAVKTTYDDLTAAMDEQNSAGEVSLSTYGIKLENMTGNTSKTYIPYDKLPEDKTSSALNAAQKVSSTSKGNTSSGTSTTTKKAAPAVGSKVTVKTTATNFSPKSNSVKMNKSVPGSTYIVYQTSGNQVLIGLSGNRYTGWVYQSDLKGYASGTSKASGGLSVVDENGFEYILGNPSKGRYQFLNNGDKVFNSKASDFLYNWANQPAEMLSSMMKSLTTTSPVSIASPCNISVGDINISGNADEKTVVELRKARKELVTEILTEFKKMKK